MIADRTAKDNILWWLPIGLEIPQALASALSMLNGLGSIVIRIPTLLVLTGAVICASILVLVRLRAARRRNEDPHESAVLQSSPAITQVLASPAAIVAIGAAMVFLWFGLPGPRVWITSPQYGDVVGSTVIARGTVRSADMVGWTVVHPMSSSGFWVQQRVSIGDDGKWAGTACFGGKDRFQVMAVMNPPKPLKEGAELKYWPQCEAKSQIVEVERQESPIGAND